MHNTLLLALLIASPARADRAPWQTTPSAAGAPEPPAPCTEADETPLAEPLRQLGVQVGDRRQPITGVRLTVEGSVPEEALWVALGGRPRKVDAGVALRLVARLERLGLHEVITPTVVPDGDGAVLEIALVEHPTVRRVVIEGAGEASPQDLLERMVEAPGVDRCAPRAEWVARADGQVLAPGVPWRGVRPALDRALAHLHTTGYELATLQARLAPDGTLTVRIDEGRLASVRIEGVDERIEPRVRARLALEPGRVFLRADVEEGARRARELFPFVDLHAAVRPLPAPAVVEAPPEGGTRRFVTAPGREQDERAYALEGRALTVHLRSRRGYFELGGAELLRHTPVTGFAPGLTFAGRLWDPADRAHLAAEGQLNVRVGGLRGEAGGADRRVDWLIGPRVAVPRLRVAEVGVLFMERIDTFDRWRIAPIDSYLWSLIANRPSADYLERRAFAAFATGHVFERLTAGVEYRNERHTSVPTYDQERLPMPVVALGPLGAGRHGVDVTATLEVVTPGSLGQVARWMLGKDGARRSALPRALLQAVASDLARSASASCPVTSPGGGTSR